MRIWSVFSLVILFHVAVIGVLLIQPGCQSQPSEAPDPSLTSPRAGVVQPQPVVEQPLDPAFNSGVAAQTPSTSASRPLSAPRRPTGVTRTEPDTGALQPVLEPVQDDLSVPTIQSEYTVRKGDNLTTIARQHGVSLSDLLSANGLNRSSTIYVGQVLMIPAGTPEDTNGSPEYGHSGKQVVVVKGDTLSKIAARTGTTVKMLKALNGLTSDTIFVGQKLLLPDSATVAAPTPAPTPTPAPSRPVTTGGQGYIVQAGDTPSGIASKFGVSTSALMAANGISDPRRLYVGRSLVIPDGSGSQPSAPSTTTVINQPVEPRSQPTATIQEPIGLEPSEDDPMSILEALEDEDLPFVEVEAVDDGNQPLN